MIIQPINTNEEIDLIYKLYTDTISSKDMATSLEQCLILSGIMQKNELKKVLDTGSGISSFFIRKYLPENCEVFTFETDTKWASKTENFIQNYNLISSNILIWNDVKDDSTINDFDFIYHDLGDIETRIDTIPNIARRLKTGGYIMLDDAHFNFPPHLQLLDTIHNYFTTENWVEVDIKNISIDGYGRYAVMYQRIN